MAVNGFLVDGAIQKYNYESLENYNTPNFSSSSIYEVGDYVMYQGKLYKCITEITTGGAWDSTKWSLAILSDDVADLKSAIKSLGDDAEIPIGGNVHNYYFGGGETYKNIAVSNATYTKVFPIKNGRKYHIVINGNVKNIGYANSEYESSGALSDNIVASSYDFFVTNSGNYAYLYVYYYNSNQAAVTNPDVYCGEVSNLATQTDLQNMYTSVVSYDGITDQKYITNTGYIGNSTKSCITDYVPVEAGRQYRLSKLYLADSRAIVYYDASKNIVSSESQGSTNTVIDITAPSGVSYLRTNGAAGVAPVIEKINHPINGDLNSLETRLSTRIGTLEESVNVDNAISVGTLIDGYVTNYNLTVFSSTTIKHTGYVSVFGGAKINVTNYCSVGANGVCAIIFDANHQGVMTVYDGVGGGSVRNNSFYLPASAAYVVFNCKPGTATLSVAYDSTQYAWSFAENIFEHLYSTAPKNFMQLFDVATKTPICCIIDDDTLTAADMENFATVMENNGIRGTVACLTKRFETESGLEDKLHDLESRGHQVVLHGYTQATAYRDALAFDDANYKAAEEDFVKGLSDLLKSGFCDPKYWVTPYGVSQACMQRLAKKWGMKCLVTSAKTDYNGTDGKYTRWELQRSGLNPDDTGTMTYQQLTALADSCAAHNGLLLINTHIYNWTDGYDRINDFITHCKNAGFEFMTLGEAWSIWKYVYDWYSTF